MRNLGKRRRRRLRAFRCCALGRAVGSVPRGGPGAAAAVTARAAAPGRSERSGHSPASSMWGFRRGSRLLPPLLRALQHPRAHITSKPPEHPLSTAVSSLGRGVSWDTRVRGAQPSSALQPNWFWWEREQRGGGRQRRDGASRAVRAPAGAPRGPAPLPASALASLLV